MTCAWTRRRGWPSWARPPRSSCCGNSRPRTPASSASSVASCSPRSGRMLVDAHADPDVVAVGEAGLDFHYDHSPRETQKDVFVRQIRLARELRKPLVVHTREADVETAEILGAELGPEGGVIHCFTSNWAAAQRYLSLGLYLSFSGVITFRNAEAVRDAAVRVPL